MPPRQCQPAHDASDAFGASFTTPIPLPTNLHPRNSEFQANAGELGDGAHTGLQNLAAAAVNPAAAPAPGINAATGATAAAQSAADFREAMARGAQAAAMSLQQAQQIAQQQMTAQAVLEQYRLITPARKSKDHSATLSVVSQVFSGITPLSDSDKPGSEKRLIQDIERHAMPFLKHKCAWHLVQQKFPEGKWDRMFRKALGQPLVQNALFHQVSFDPLTGQPTGELAPEPQHTKFLVDMQNTTR